MNEGYDSQKTHNSFAHSFHLAQLASLRPPTALLRQEAATLLVRAGRYREAAKEYEKVQVDSEAKNVPECLLCRFVCWTHAGDSLRAEFIGRELLTQWQKTRTERSADALCRAWAMQPELLTEPGPLLAYLKNSVKENPRSSEANYRYGVALFHTRDYSSAIKALDHSQQLQPRSLRTQAVKIFLAMAYHKKGDDPEAKRQWKTVNEWFDKVHQRFGPGGPPRIHSRWLEWEEICLLHEMAKKISVGKVKAQQRFSRWLR